MSIVDEALQKLNRDSSTGEGGALSRKYQDIGLVAGKRKRKPISLLLAIALLFAGGIVYLLLPKEIPPLPRKAESEFPIPPINPPATLQKPVVAAISGAVPVSAVAIASAVIPVSSVSAIPALAGVTAPVKTVIAETHEAASAVAAVVEYEQFLPAPAWYKDGWKAANAGKWTTAFALWEEGMRGLPKDHIVIVSNSYSSMDLLEPGLNQHARLFPAVGVRQFINGQAFYRVIAFPYGGGNRKVLPKVKVLFSHAVLFNASRVQARLTENSHPVVAKPEQVMARKEMQVASPKPSLVSQPPVEQKSTVAQIIPAEQKSSVVQQPIENLETKNRIAVDTAEGTKKSDWETLSATVRDQLKEENYPEVSKNAQMLTHDYPERWEGWFWMGTAQLAQGQMDAAESALERASKLNSKLAQIWIQRAIVAQERSDHASAIKLLNVARELEPKSPQIYLNLGYSNDALGLTDEANKHYLRFLSLTEGDNKYALQRKPIIQRLESRH